MCYSRSNSEMSSGRKYGEQLKESYEFKLSSGRKYGEQLKESYEFKLRGK